MIEVLNKETSYMAQIYCSEEQNQEVAEILAKLLSNSEYSENGYGFIIHKVESNRFRLIKKKISSVLL